MAGAESKLPSAEILSRLWASGRMLIGMPFVCFDWKADCIEGTRLQFTSMAGPPLRSAFCRLSSEGQVSIDMQADAVHCWLREYHVQGGRLLKTSCENAEAAASVAIGGSVRRLPHLSAPSSPITLRNLGPRHTSIAMFCKLLISLDREMDIYIPIVFNLSDGQSYFSCHTH